MWKFISNEPNESESCSGATEICEDNIQNKNKIITKNQPRPLFRERGKKLQLTIGTNNLMT